MDTSVFQSIRASLLEQRRNLTDWLSTTPARERQVRLGPVDERSVQAHLRVLDTAIEKTEDQTLGLCEVCHDYIEEDQLVVDYTRCVCLEHLSSEERGRLEFELELSAKVQQALLPQQVPEIPGLEIAAFSGPAEIVGGDYFDFFRFWDGAHGLVVGDVAGHGMSASLLMASLQATLRTLAPDYGAPTEVVRRLNLLFSHNIHMTSFVTLFLARFDSETYDLTYCNAGHNPPLLRTRTNGNEELSWLRPTGAAIGLAEGFLFGSETVNLTPGGVLLFYTDGITEAMNPQGELFGQDRLVELLRQGSHQSAQELVRNTRYQLQDFAHGRPFSDDTTIIVCKVDEAKKGRSH
jgi:sigma-B regulation protein RsbU (phosphoserine phosphatase)